MKEDARKIGWRLVIAQIVYQLSIVLFASIFNAILDINPNKILYVATDIGSVIANVLIIGTLSLKKNNALTDYKENDDEFGFIRITNKDHRVLMNCKIILTGFIILFMINMIFSTIDFFTMHLLSASGSGVPAFSIVFSMFTLALVPAVCEEYAYRKVIFKYMRKHGFLVAAFFSSFCFSLMHLNFLQIGYAFIIGLIFCYIYEKTDNYYLTIILHFLNNAFVVSVQYIPDYYKFGEKVEMILGIISFCIVIYVFIKKKGRSIFGSVKNNYIMQKGHIRLCYLNVPMIIYLIYCVGVSVLMVLTRMEIIL